MIIEATFISQKISIHGSDQKKSIVYQLESVVKYSMSKLLLYRPAQHEGYTH